MGAFLQGNEIWIILLILLLLLGPSKLPALARGLGQALREFKKAAQGLDEDFTPKTVTSTTTRASLARIESGQDNDDKVLMELAKKLGVSTEGKTREEIKREVLKEAEEKGLV